MSDDKDEKEESTSITTHSRRRNLISGIDDAHLALGVAGLAVGAVAFIAAKPAIETFMQNMNLAKNNQAPPPPPPVEPVQAAPVQAQAQTEYTEEEQVGIRQPNGSAQTTPDNEELQEVDHKNYQMRRKPRNGSGSESPFGKAIARG